VPLLLVYGYIDMDMDELYDSWPGQSQLSGLNSQPGSAPKPSILDHHNPMSFELPPEYTDLPPLPPYAAISAPPHPIRPESHPLFLCSGMGYHPQMGMMPMMQPQPQHPMAHPMQMNPLIHHHHQDHQPMTSMAALSDQMVGIMQQPMLDQMHTGSTPHPSDRDPSSSTGGMGYSSPSASGSPPWSPPSFNGPEGDGIDLSNLTDPHVFSVELLQKPRGSNGRWLAVEPAQRIRVAAKLGKMLKIVMRTPLPVDWESMRLIALERSVSGETNAEEHPWRISPGQKEAFAILTKKVLDHAENADGQPVSAVQLDIKLFLVYRSIAFLAEVTNSSGQVMRAISVSLSTHNSGSSDNKRKRDRITTDNDYDDSPQGARGGYSPASPEDDDSIFVPSSNQSMPMPSIVEPVYPSPAAMVKQQDPMAVDQGPLDGSMPYPTPGQDRPWQVVPGNLQVEGVVRAHGYSQFSDIRLKTDIADIAEAMQIVQQLSGKSYRWKKNTGVAAIDAAEELTGGKRVIGLIAQEVQRVLPEVVQEGEDGYLAVNYAEIVPVLIEAFKEQVSHFKEIQTQVSTTLSKHANHQDELLIELGKISKQIQKLRRQKAKQQREEAKHHDEATTSSSEDTSSSSEEKTSAPSNRKSHPRHHAKDVSSSVEMKSLVKGGASPSKAEPKSESISMAKAGILIGLLALAVGVTIFLGVFLGIRANAKDGSPATASFASRNYAINPGFEEVDPSDPLKATSWSGDYTVHKYALTRKRATFANAWPLVSNASLYFESGNNAIRTSVPLSSANQTTYAITATTQTLSIGKLLRDAKPSAQELAQTTGIFVSAWCTTIYAPRDVNGNVTSQNMAVNGTLPSISITALTRDASGALFGPRIVTLTKRIAVLSPWHWQQHTVFVPVNVTQLETVDLYIYSSIIGDVFWDNVGVYFNYVPAPASAPIAA
jgi:hypothetical protein